MRIVGFLLAATALVVAGCATTQPIQNVQNAPVILPPGKSATTTQVGQAIMRAGTNLDARDGMIHRNYNNWVHNLDKGIRSQLSLL
jgi:L-aminopeptidase/D-esterase-like protein